MTQDVNLLVENGETIRILPNVTGSEKGFEYRLEKVDTGGNAMAEIPLKGDYGISIDGNSYMTIDTEKLAAGNYVLTISTKENKEVTSVVKFVKTAPVTVSDGNAG